MTTHSLTTRIAGWREWLSLPDLGIPGITAKVDTGKQTSVLHAQFIESYRNQGEHWVRFGVHPLPGREDVRLVSQAPVKEQRIVTDVSGHEEECLVIASQLSLGEHQSEVDLILTKRDAKTFRMLLGRSALQKLKLLVNAETSYLLGTPREGAYCPGG